MPANPPLKTFSFGGCNFSGTSPGRSKLSGKTPMLNVWMTFEDALKLNIAIQACVSRLNSYNRSKARGKRTGLNIVVHLKKNRLTVNEANL